jgi:membrane-associated protein
MEVIANIDFADLFLHLDTALQTATANYHTYVYLIMFAVIFCQIGTIVLLILPADSVLFTAGALAATANSELDIRLVCLVLLAAAVLGNNSNYWIGRIIGKWILSNEKIRRICQRYIDATGRFYERYGGTTLVIARFLHGPRTFIPFVGGISRMNYGKFFIFSAAGSVLWVSVYTLGGYFFGKVPAVKENFVLVIIAVVVIAVSPAVIEYIRQKTRTEKHSGKK